MNTDSTLKNNCLREEGKNMYESWENLCWKHQNWYNEWEVLIRKQLEMAQRIIFLKKGKFLLDKEERKGEQKEYSGNNMI